jgi:hypothetical protein
VHLYPLRACGSGQDATIDELLSPGAANEVRSLAWVVADANAAGVPAILSEANSASCGGQPNISDSPASAVWAVRFVLNALKTGFREVRFHFSGGAYDPFVVHGGQIISRPLQSALIALNQWLPLATKLQTIPGVRGLQATAVGGPAGSPMLILDNETSKTQTVVLRGAWAIRIEVLDASGPGLKTARISSSDERIKLPVASNSVLGVLPAP